MSPRLEPPSWLDPAFWRFWSDLDEADQSADLKPVCDLVVAHHAELKAIFREIVRRHATSWRRPGVKIGAFVTPAPPLWNPEPEGDEDERQQWAFFSLVMAALRAHAHGVRIDIVGPYGEPDPKQTVVRVGRILVPTGVERASFVHAMGVLHHVANFSILLWGKPQKAVACKIVGLITGVDLGVEHARSLISEKFADEVSAIIQADERDADLERLIAKANRTRAWLDQLVEDYRARQAEIDIGEPPEPPPEPADAV
jgi:hypothetical protein